jgi:hypothetical protein
VNLLEKGQSSIEYLTTYGWMLLAVAIVGVTVFSVIGNEEEVQQLSGFGDEDLRVNDAEFTSDEKLSLSIRNWGEDKVDIQKVNLTVDGQEIEARLPDSETFPVNSRQQRSFNVCAKDQSVSGEEADIELIYSTTSGIEYSASGSITGGINLQKCTGSTTLTVTGKVSASPGKPGVEVKAYQGEDLKKVTKTNSEGEYTFTLKPGKYSFEASGIKTNAVDLSKGDKKSYELDFNFSKDAIEINIAGETKKVANTPQNIEKTECEVNGEPRRVSYIREEDSVKISTVEQLQCLGNVWSSEVDNAKLVQDIYASKTEEWNSGRGFRPIEEVSSLDGRGYEIRNLHSQRERAGLIINLDNELKNIGIVDADLQGQVAAPVSQSTGTILNFYSSGNVTGQELEAGVAAENGGRIVNSYSTVEVSGQATGGGLVAFSEGSAIDSVSLEDPGRIRRQRGRVAGIDSSTAENLMEEYEFISDSSVSEARKDIMKRIELYITVEQANNIEEANAQFAEDLANNIGNMDSSWDIVAGKDSSVTWNIINSRSNVDGQQPFQRVRDYTVPEPEPPFEAGIEGPQTVQEGVDENYTLSWSGAGSEEASIDSINVSGENNSLTTSLPPLEGREGSVQLSVKWNTSGDHSISTAISDGGQVVESSQSVVVEGLEPSGKIQSISMANGAFGRNTRATLGVGDSNSLEALITNQGEKPGRFKTQLSIAGSNYNQITRALEPGESDYVSFPVTQQLSAGRYDAVFKADQSKVPESGERSPSLTIYDFPQVSVTDAKWYASNNTAEYTLENQLDQSARLDYSFRLRCSTGQGLSVEGEGVRGGQAYVDLDFQSDSARPVSGDIIVPVSGTETLEVTGDQLSRIDSRASDIGCREENGNPAYTLRIATGDVNLVSRDDRTGSALVRGGFNEVFNGTNVTVEIGSGDYYQANATLQPERSQVRLRMNTLHAGVPDAFNDLGITEKDIFDVEGGELKNANQSNQLQNILDSGEYSLTAYVDGEKVTSSGSSAYDKQLLSNASNALGNNITAMINTLENVSETETQTYSFLQERVDPNHDFLSNEIQSENWANAREVTPELASSLEELGSIAEEESLLNLISENLSDAQSENTKISNELGSGEGSSTQPLTIESVNIGRFGDRFRSHPDNFPDSFLGPDSEISYGPYLKSFYTGKVESRPEAIVAGSGYSDYVSFTLRSPVLAGFMESNQFLSSGGFDRIGNAAELTSQFDVNGSTKLFGFDIVQTDASEEEPWTLVKQDANMEKIGISYSQESISATMNPAEIQMERSGENKNLSELSGNSFGIKITFNDGFMNALGQEGQKSVSSQTLEIRSPAVTLGLNNNLVAEPRDNQTVFGQSNLPPGTDMNISVEADGLYNSKLASVDQSGNFVGLFDFSDLAADQRFNATVSLDGKQLVKETGNIQSLDSELVDPSPPYNPDSGEESDSSGSWSG